MRDVLPTIGLTFSSVADATSPAAVALYIGAVGAHGAHLVKLLPDASPVDVEELDGLLLPGGGDVDPSWYAEAPHPRLGRVDGPRDHLEISLTREAVARGVPVLGICRGAQVLGVALGGTLHQDIPSCFPGALPHTTQIEGGARHVVYLQPDSRLREILGEDAPMTNSFHHQANAALGPHLRAIAWSEDGIIEGIESIAGGFVIGVQWHPERMVPQDLCQVRLFAAFVEAARRRRAERGE